MSDLSFAPASVADGFIRYLGSAERFLWLADQCSPTHFVMCLEILGFTTEADWKRALDAVVKRHPLLMASICVDTDQRPYFRHEVESLGRIRILKNADWKAEVSNELASPVLWESAPLMRAAVSLEHDKSHLILSFHHSIADGRSALLIVRDMLRVIEGEVLDPLPLPSSYESHLSPDEDLTEAPPPSPGSPSKDKPAAFVDVDSRRPMISSATLPEALTRRLREKARDEGASIQSAVITALTFCVSPHPGDNVRILNPLDIRPLLGDSDTRAMYATILPVEITSPSRAGFWSRAAAVKADLAGLATKPAILNNMTFNKYVTNAAPTAEAFKGALSQILSGHEFIVSNVGVLPYASSIGRLKISNIWGPAALFGTTNEQSIGICTVDDKLTMLHTSSSPRINLLSELEQVLQEFCS